MYSLKVDFSKITGKIKPMHAVNRAPVVPYDKNPNCNFFDKLAEAHVPYARLHDVGGAFGGTHYVDITNVFPNFDADETDPASYDFAFTDVLLEHFSSRGIEPFYRLGQTIENNHNIKAYTIYPPKDVHKWARICEHIIRHYNEGWADGKRLGIRYWEIWNEPDNDETPEKNQMWKGTEKQFYELYDVSTRYLKSIFPDLLFGGYGSCGFYALSGVDASGVALSSSRTLYFLEFLEGFLKYCKAHDSVMDFFSWHSYATNIETAHYAAYAREKLTEYGYGDVEIFLNEWNPDIALRGKVADASNILCGMCMLQDTSTDMVMYYDAQAISSYCGIFDPVHHDVFPAYYSFYLFGKLYTLGLQVSCKLSSENEPEHAEVYALGATDGKNGALLFVNNTDKPVQADISFTGTDNYPSTLSFITENGLEQRSVTIGADGRFVADVPAFGVWSVQ